MHSFFASFLSHSRIKIDFRVEMLSFLSCLAQWRLGSVSSEQCNLFLFFTLYIYSCISYIHIYHAAILFGRNSTALKLHKILHLFEREFLFTVVVYSW